MGRIRLEWSNLWDILGEHFNQVGSSLLTISFSFSLAESMPTVSQVCCHSNPHVGFFALDSLRQLATWFLEKELPHFKFQKDFLRSFEYTMMHNANLEIRDMVSFHKLAVGESTELFLQVLQCLQQMTQAHVQNMRSGWRTMFGVFSAASKVLTGTSGLLIL